MVVDIYKQTAQPLKRLGGAHVSTKGCKRGQKVQTYIYIVQLLPLYNVHYWGEPDTCTCRYICLCENQAYCYEVMASGSHIPDWNANLYT